MDFKYAGVDEMNLSSVCSELNCPDRVAHVRREHADKVLCINVVEVRSRLVTAACVFEDE